MSTAQDRPPPTSAAVWSVLRRVASSYLVQFLGFVAVLVLVVVMLARQPAGCECASPKAQIVLFALAGMLALAGTVLLAPHGTEPQGPTPGRRGPDRSRAGVVLIGTAVVLVAVAGLVGLW